MYYRYNFTVWRHVQTRCHYANALAQVAVPERSKEFGNSGVGAYEPEQQEQNEKGELEDHSGKGR